MAATPAALWSSPVPMTPPTNPEGGFDQVASPVFWARTAADAHDLGALFGQVLAFGQTIAERTNVPADMQSRLGQRMVTVEVDQGPLYTGCQDMAGHARAQFDRARSSVELRTQAAHSEIVDIKTELLSTQDFSD